MGWRNEGGGGGGEKCRSLEKKVVGLEKNKRVWRNTRVFGEKARGFREIIANTHTHISRL